MFVVFWNSIRELAEVWVPRPLHSESECEAVWPMIPCFTTFLNESSACYTVVSTYCKQRSAHATVREKAQGVVLLWHVTIREF